MKFNKLVLISSFTLCLNNSLHATEEEDFVNDKVRKYPSMVHHSSPAEEHLFNPSNFLSSLTKFLCEKNKKGSHSEADDELLALIVKLNESTLDGGISDEDVCCAIDFMVARGVSVADISTSLKEAGIPIPSQAKIDRGLNEFFGGVSLLGSASSHFKSIYSNGLARWVVNNGATALGYYSTAKLIFSLIAPAAAVELNAQPQNECAMPKGTWDKSCFGSKAKPYPSSDHNLPPTCILETECATMYEGLPKASNTVYYDKSRPPTYINNNGTLSVVDTLGEVVTAQSHSYDCKAVQGSFQKTCDISAVPYTPSDLNLVNQFFCVMTSKCRDLVGSLVHAKNVFYKSTLADKTTKFENCNGELVVHTDPKRDGMCDGKSSEQMQAALSQIAAVGNQHSGYTLREVKDEL